jgi:class 3 adenylate cyclase
VIVQPDTSSDSPARRGADIRTFLFADVRGYTRFTHEHGDEAASVLAARFADIVRDAVPRFEGELLELRGDEALCVFSSARQALRSAVELQGWFRRRVDGESVLPLGVGMGLDAGEAVPTQGGYRGGALNLAARLCAIAKPGQILASDHAAHLAGRVEGVRLVDRRPVRLKGVERAVRLMEVVPEHALPPLPPPPDPGDYPQWLVRVRWGADGGLWLECPDGDGDWTFVPGLPDYFIGKEMGAVEITIEQRRATATARGTDLDAHLDEAET